MNMPADLPKLPKSLLDPLNKISGQIRAVLIILTSIYGSIQAFDIINPTDLSKAIVGWLGVGIAAMTALTRFTNVGTNEDLEVIDTTAVEVVPKAPDAPVDNGAAPPLEPAEPWHGEDLPAGDPGPPADGEVIDPIDPDFEPG